MAGLVTDLAGEFDETMVNSITTFRAEAVRQSDRIFEVSDQMNKDYSDLDHAKRTKVTKLASTRRKLKYSSETFNEYTRSINSLFEYFEDQTLIDKIRAELGRIPKGTGSSAATLAAQPPAAQSPPSQPTPSSSANATPHRPLLRAFLDQLKRSLERVKTNYKAFYDMCSKAELKAREGSDGSRSYALKTEKKKTDRRVNARNLAINQFGIAIGAVITFVIFMVLLGIKTVTFNGGVAAAVTVSVLAAGTGLIIGSVAIYAIVTSKHKYNEIQRIFYNIEKGFEEVDIRIGSLKNLLLSQVHTQMLAVEKLIIDSEELLKEDTSYNSDMLLITFEILVKKSYTYNHFTITTKEGEKFKGGKNLGKLFDIWKNDTFAFKPKRKEKPPCGCLFSRTADDHDDHSTPPPAANRWRTYDRIALEEGGEIVDHSRVQQH